MSVFDLIPNFSRAPAQRTNDGTAVKPFYRVQEQPEQYELTVYLPGVAKENLEITAENGVLTITGRRAWKRPEGWTAVYRETSDMAYELTLSHENNIDVDQIRAELRDGVLRVELPKSEALKPRKIAIA